MESCPTRPTRSRPARTPPSAARCASRRLRPRRAAARSHGDRSDEVDFLRMLRVLRRFRVGGGDKSPLSIAGDARGVLCLHGITGTPFEIRPLAEALGAKGCTVIAPQLAGHCGTLRDLADSTWRDWLQSAEQAFDELCRRVGGGPVAICGFSMGGLLALRLARLYPQRVSALVAMSTPLRLRRFQVLGIRALARLPFDFRAHPGAVRPEMERLRHLRRGDALRKSRPARLPDRGADAAPGSDGHRAHRSAGDPHAGDGGPRPPGPHGADGGFAGADRLSGRRRHRTAVARQELPHGVPGRGTGGGDRRRDAIPRPPRRLAGGRRLRHGSTGERPTSKTNGDIFPPPCRT